MVRERGRTRSTSEDRQVTESAFVSDPDRWPKWPVLPLINRSDGRAGYLLGDPVLPLRVFAGNIWAISNEDPVVGTYASADELVGDWRVD